MELFITNKCLNFQKINNAIKKWLGKNTQPLVSRLYYSLFNL